MGNSEVHARKSFVTYRTEAALRVEKLVLFGTHEQFFKMDVYEMNPEKRGEKAHAKMNRISSHTN